MAEYIWVKKPGGKPNRCRLNALSIALREGYERCDPPDEAEPEPVDIAKLEADAVKPGGRQKLEAAALQAGVDVKPGAKKTTILDKVAKAKRGRR